VQLSRFLGRLLENDEVVECLRNRTPYPPSEWALKRGILIPDEHNKDLCLYYRFKEVIRKKDFVR
jgi:hypothetical protein